MLNINEVKFESGLTRLSNSLLELMEVEPYYSMFSNFKEITNKVMSEGSIQSLKEVILENPEYTSDRVVISLYYYIFNKEDGWEDSSIILTFLSYYLEGEEPPINVDCLLEFVDNDLEFNKLSIDEQRILIGNKIREKVIKQ